MCGGGGGTTPYKRIGPEMLDFSQSRKFLGSCNWASRAFRALNSVFLGRKGRSCIFFLGLESKIKPPVESSNFSGLEMKRVPFHF